MPAKRSSNQDGTGPARRQPNGENAMTQEPDEYTEREERRMPSTKTGGH